MRKNECFFLSITAALLLLASTPAQAVNVPSSAEPSRASSQIAPLATPPAPEGAGRVTSNAVLQAPKGADKIKFKLVSLTVEGMTAYTDADVAPLYGDMIGKTVALTDVYAVANALTVKYRNDGYILTQVAVPPQTIENGHVRLRVVEGVVNDIRIEGETHGRLSDLQFYADKIKAARPFSSKLLERYLLLMNDLPGITANAVLSPAKVPGATDILIAVGRKPYDLFFQADNRGSRFLGPLQLNTGLRLNNMLGFYEGINLQYALAPDDNELNYGSLSITEPLGYEGTRLTVGGNVTRTRPGFTLTPLDVRGLAKNIDLELMHPFIRSRQENLFTTLRFNYLDSHRTDIGGVPTDDRLSVVRLGSVFQLVDDLAGVNTLSAEVSKGLDIFGSTGPNNPTTTRPGADNTFLKGTAELSRVQRLSPHFDLFGSAAGQWSAERLFSSEQFGLGGITYGSAYDSSEITGDQGIAARAELRLNDPLQTPLQATQLYTFYDIGKVWDLGNTVAADRIASLASAGVGLRLSLNKNFSGSFEWAKPLTRNVGSAGNEKPRIFGAITARF